LLKSLAGKMQHISTIKVLSANCPRNSLQSTAMLCTLAALQLLVLIYIAYTRVLAVVLQYSGRVTYNGCDFNEFLPQTASVYIEQVWQSDVIVLLLKHA
jgi:hypothetical protein